MNKILELITYYKKKGLVETLSRIRLRYFSITRFILYRRDLDQDYHGIQLSEEYKVLIDDFNFLNETRTKRDNLPREFYVDKTHNGKHFYLVLKGDEVAYIHWVLLINDYSRFFYLKNSKTAELNYNITLPAFRGDRLMAKTINFICVDLKSKGYKTLVGAASEGNILTQKSLQRTGFYPFRKVLSMFSIIQKTKV